MKLAIVTQNIIRGDGQGRVALELARHALLRGDEVWLFADRVGPEIVEMGATWIKIQPRMRKPDLLKVWEFTRMADRALEHIDVQFDIIQAFGFVITRPHDANNSQFVHAAWMKSPVHIAKTRRDLYGLYQWIYTRANIDWEQNAYRKARTIIPSSERIRQELVGAGLGNQPMSTVHNGVDLVEFHPGQANRASLGLPSDVTLGLFVGDIRTSRKNLDTVLRALVDVPDLHLAVAGATERSPFPALAERLGITDRVHFLGFRKDIAELMRATDLFAFPSRYEACSLVVLEAMASGLPVITAQTAGGAEILTPPAGVVLDNPDDRESLVAALRTLSSDPKLRAQMALEARRVAENYSWRHMAEAYFEVYGRLLIPSASNTRHLP